MKPDALVRHARGVLHVVEALVVGELAAVVAELRDRALPDRDDDLLVEGGRAELDLAEIDALDVDAGLLLRRMARLPPACSWSSAVTAAFDPLERLLLVRRLDQERHLGNRRAGPHVERDLVLEDLQQRAEGHPEHPLELAERPCGTSRSSPARCCCSA